MIQDGNLFCDGCQQPIPIGIEPRVQVLVELQKGSSDRHFLQQVHESDAEHLRPQRTRWDRAEMNSELVIRYDADLQPISAQCSSCGQQMPSLPSDLHETADRVIWLSDRFIEHKKSKHSTPPYRNRAPQQSS